MFHRPNLAQMPLHRLEMCPGEVSRTIAFSPLE